MTKASDIFERGVSAHLEWKYESDGGYGSPKTFYLTNGEERIDFDSKKEAMRYLQEINWELLEEEK